MTGRPNLLFIHTDQQRYDTLGCNGSAVARTPNIDGLAAKGVRFERCITSNPVCMPARASWATGQYPSHNGCWQNGAPLPESADMIQTRLKAAGYHTGHVGKIHLDNIWQRQEPHPSYGFDVMHECEGDPYCMDEYFRWLDGQGLYAPYKEQFDREGHARGYTRDLPEEKHQNNWIAAHVEDYLDRRAEDGKPFFLSVGFFDPHHPFDPVEPYASMFSPEAMPDPIGGGDAADAMTPPARDRVGKHGLSDAELKGAIAAYHATIAHVDAMVGRILERLDAAGLADRTVVVFTSDHGEMLGDHGVLWKGSLFYDGAIRVPLIYRLPEGMGPAGVVDTGFCSHVDLAPTLAALAGIDPPRLAQGRPLFDRDGRLRPVPAPDGALCEWRDRPFDRPDDPFQTARCLVTDAWKLVHYDGEPYGELYNRAEDPEERVNLWDDPDHAAVKAELREELLAFLIRNEPLPTRTDLF
ncbi:MAG: sulfatase [Planctomycetota bacterium]